MKIRTDFVSNSSSSSFILAGDNKKFKHLKKKDFIDAFISLANCDPHDTKWFSIYDKNLKNDNKKLNSSYTDWLNYWYSPYLSFDYNKNEVIYHPVVNNDNFKLRKWNMFYEHMREVYNLPWEWHPNITTYLDYDHKKETSVEKKINKSVLKVLTDTYQHYGILTNYQVLQAGFSRFLIHFGDNDIYCMSGIAEPSKNENFWKENNEYSKKHNEQIKNSTWETEPYTPERFCEMMTNWFKEHKKIPEDTTWEEFSNLILACTLHEG